MKLAILRMVHAAEGPKQLHLASSSLSGGFWLILNADHYRVTELLQSAA